MNQGYSLLELLIVISILSLMTCLSYPSFNHSMLRTQRVNGQTALLDLASRMERYYMEHGTYKKATIHTGTANDVLENNLSADGLYELSIAHVTDTTYELWAKTTRSDKECTVLIYNNLGLKTTINPENARPCW